jgi:hypothetical protein
MFSYSHNEEHYTGEFATRELAIAEARAEGLSKFWTGENRPPDVMFGIDGQDVIEQICQLEDFYIEQAEDWPEASKEQVDELTEGLRKTFKAWMEKHNLTPKFWLVEDVQMHQFFDAIAVSSDSGEILWLEPNKTEDAAEGIIKMAIARQGVEDRFFVAVPAGKYHKGDKYEG